VAASLREIKSSRFQFLISRISILEFAKPSPRPSVHLIGQLGGTPSSVRNSCPKNRGSALDARRNEKSPRESIFILPAIRPIPPFPPRVSPAIPVQLGRPNDFSPRLSFASDVKGHAPTERVFGAAIKIRAAGRYTMAENCVRFQGSKHPAPLASAFSLFLFLSSPPHPLSLSLSLFSPQRRPSWGRAQSAGRLDISVGSLFHAPSGQ